MKFQAQFPWPEEVLRANSRPSAFHAPKPIWYIGATPHPCLPRPPWRNQTFRPVQPDTDPEPDIPHASATTKTPQDPQPSLPLYRTKFLLWLPSMIQFHPVSSTGRLHSYQRAFLILLHHLQTCDPSATIFPTLVGCCKLTELANPPIGPDTPGYLPSSLD